MTTKYEEARQCPKCGKPGEVTDQTPSQDSRGRPVTVHTVYCRNQLCPWLDTNWIIQVNQDGSIPDPYSALGRKMYPAVSPEMETRITESIQAQLDAETRPGGGEVRGNG